MARGGDLQMDWCAATNSAWMVFVIMSSGERVRDMAMSRYPWVLVLATFSAAVDLIKESDRHLCARFRHPCAPLRRRERRRLPRACGPPMFVNKKGPAWGSGPGERRKFETDPLLRLFLSFLLCSHIFALLFWSTFSLSVQPHFVAMPYNTTICSRLQTYCQEKFATTRFFRHSQGIQSRRRATWRGLTTVVDGESGS